MVFSFRMAIISLLATSVISEYQDFHGFEGLGLEHEYHQPILHHHQPVLHHQHQSLDDHGEEYDVDYHAHPKYSFDYSVKDPHTGDNKDHWETRDGDKVKGIYSLIETDGTKRVVEYEADDKNGFNAVVHKIGTPIHHHKEEQKPVYEKEELSPTYHYDEGFSPILSGYEHK